MMQIKDEHLDMSFVSYEHLVDKITEGTKDRVNLIARFYPFFKLSISGFKMDKYKHLNFDMGFLVLSIIGFFVEEGNLKNKGITYFQYVEFLRTLILKSYKVKLNEEEIRDVASYVFDKMMNEGAAFSFKYFNPEKGDDEFKKVRYIKGEVNISDDKNYYFLSNAAIEFYLTKEISDENKISIELILLKKLVDSGNFESALDGVKRLNGYIGVHIAKKREVLESIMYGNADAFEQYINYNKTSIKCLRDEQDLFVETVKFLSSTLSKYINKIEKNQLSDKEKRSFQILNTIERELKVTMEKHAILINESVKLSSEFGSILDANYQSLFSEYFNLSVYYEEVIESNDIRKFKNILDPLLQINPIKMFSLNKIDDLFNLTPSALHEEKKEDDEKEEVNVETIDNIVSDRVNHNYAVFTKELLLFLNIKEQGKLEDFIEYLNSKYSEEVCFNPDFYSFFISVYQHRENSNESKKFYIDRILNGLYKSEIDEVIRSVILSMDLIDTFKGTVIEIKATEEILEIQNGFKMTNFYLKLTKEMKL